MDRTVLHLSASIDELRRLGDAVAQFCARNGIGAKLAYTLQLVCDEWVTNIIMHGYGYGRGLPPDGEGGNAPITVALARIGASEVQLEFVDRARPFDPLAHAAPNVALPVEERQVGGLGIHFIRKMMDSCVYERTADGNKLVLTKRIGDMTEEHSK